jgi:DNA-binding response OmpR family regulator
VEILAVQEEPGELAEVMRRRGHGVKVATSGAAAVVKAPCADLVLLDLDDVPDMDGIDVCERIRGRTETPLIAFAGSCEARAHQVAALHAGADDCLVKPYEISELMARIDALMRRFVPLQRTGELVPDIVCENGLRIDRNIRQVYVHEAPVEVTRKEFDLLVTLASSPTAVVSRQRLMADIWEMPDDSPLNVRATRTLDTHVNSLRRKLGDRNWIVTVRGIGFRWGSVIRRPIRVTVECG